MGEILFDFTHLDSTIATAYLEFVAGMIESKVNSAPDFSSEIFHWEREYHACKYRGKPLFGQIKPKECKESLRFSIEHLQIKICDKLKVIEVGCGPTSQFYAEELVSKPLEIVTVDPLAKVYSRLHKQYKTGYDIVCFEGYGETLERLFQKETFHLVYSQNAIDHSVNPQLFVENMYKILKVGGYLVLHGFINEGTKAMWLGLHQWNIQPKNNELLLRNRSGTINEKKLTSNLRLLLISEKVYGETYTFIYEKLPNDHKNTINK